MTEQPKNPTPKRELTEAEIAFRSWDKIVQQAINKELVGSAGYRKIQGRITVVNIQFLPLERVQRVEIVACKALRTYRMAVLKQFDNDKEFLETQKAKLEADLQGFSFLQVNEKKMTTNLLMTIKVQLDALAAMRKSVENVHPMILQAQEPKIVVANELPKN